MRATCTEGKSWSADSFWSLFLSSTRIIAGRSLSQPRDYSFNSRFLQFFSMHVLPLLLCRGFTMTPPSMTMCSIIVYSIVYRNVLPKKRKKKKRKEEVQVELFTRVSKKKRRRGDYLLKKAFERQPNFEGALLQTLFEKKIRTT